MIIALLIQLAFTQDFKLIRRTQNQINESQKFTLEQIPESKVEFDQSFLINETKEFYYFKDVYNNVNLTINNTDFQMYIDLTGPWSWYTSSECKYSNLTFKEFTLHPEPLNQSCTTSEFNKSMQLSGNKDDISRITSDTQQIQGLQRNTNISLGNVTVELTVLEINQVISPARQLADGALSFAAFNTTFKHSFMSDYLKQNPNHFVQFTDTQISFLNQIPNNTEIVKLNNLNNTHQWRFKVNNISLYNKVKSQEQVATAVLSLNTQFIQLPQKLLDTVKKSILSENPVTMCEFVDNNLYLLKCINLVKSQFDQLNFTLILDQTNLTIKSESLIKSCQNSSNGQSDCIFNIRASQNDFIILGEPIFKDNQIVFNFNETSLGFIKQKQPKTENPQDLEFSRMQQWIIGLTMLFVLAFCILNIKHVYKWIVRAIRYRKAVNTEDEQQLRNKEVEFGEMEKAEQMTQSIEENSI